MRLLETIRIEKGEPLNLFYHQKRMNSSRKELFNSKDEIDLVFLLKVQSIPIVSSIQKCRVIYDTSIREVEIISYEIPQITSLKLLHCDDIDYAYKYQNRGKIEELFSKRGIADDIIIVKDGMITDTSYANLLFFDGEQWITPAKPLLQGTQRAKVLAEKRIVEADITPIDLVLFERIRLINAMIRFEDEVDIKVQDIST